MKRVFVIILLVIFFRDLIAQKYFPVKHFTISQGLSSHKINDVVYDYDNFIWIATENGLNRFDGYRFNIFSYSPFDTNSIANNIILDLETDFQNKLWILYSNGIQVLDLNSGDFIPLDKYSSDASLTFQGPFLKSAFDKRTLWFITDKQVEVYKTDSLQLITRYDLEDKFEDLDHSVIVFGDSLLYHLQNGILEEFRPCAHNKLIKNKINFRDIDYIFDIESVGENQLLLITSTGFYSYQILNKSYSQVWALPFNLSKKEKYTFAFQNPKVYTITADSLFEYNIESHSVKAVARNNVNFDNAGNIKNAMADHTGLLWVSTDRGLYCVNLYPTGFDNFSIQELLSIDSVKITQVECDNEYNWLAVENSVYLLDAMNNKILYQLDLCNIIPGEKEIVINQIKRISNNEVLIATSAGLIKLDKVTTEGLTGYIPKILMDGIYSKTFAYDADGRIWLVTNDKLIRYDISSGKTKPLSLLKSGNDTLLPGNISFIQSVNELLWLVTDEGLVRYNCNTGKFKVYYPNNDSSFYFPGLKVSSLRIDKFGQPWIATSYGFAYVENQTDKLKMLNLGNNNYYNISSMEIIEEQIWFASDKGISRLDGYTTPEQNVIDYTMLTGSLDFQGSSSTVNSNGRLVFSTNDGFIMFNADNVSTANYYRNPVISSVKLVDENNWEKAFYFNTEYFIINKSVKYCEIELSAIDYYSPGKILYKYKLQKGNKQSNWEYLNKNKLLLSGLKPGKYKLEIAPSGNKSADKSSDIVHFIAESAFYETKLAYIIYGFLIVLMGYIFVRYRTRRLYKINKEYKEKEVISKKIAEQKEQLSVKNKSITDSINYAKRIQMAMMPSEKKFRSIFPNGFILHLPKDIVSGDFYWVSEVDNKAFMAAVDCTGHGVPGAFMSIIGFELFRRITDEKRIRQPSEILNNLSKGFEDIFKDVENMTLRDGMDLALCSIDKKNSLLEFSGAFNPLYLVRDNTITEIKGDRFSVGLDTNENEELIFKNHVIPVKKGDILYIFTDGYADQFGGPEGKKYKYRRFRHLLLALHQLPMQQQKQFLQDSILEWKGDLDQVDDILVIGIKVDFDKTKAN